MKLLSRCLCSLNINNSIFRPLAEPETPSIFTFLKVFFYFFNVFNVFLGLRLCRIPNGTKSHWNNLSSGVFKIMCTILSVKKVISVEITLTTENNALLY